MKLTILGASGHAKVVADVAAYCGYDQIEFLDDNMSLTDCGSWPVIGECSKATEVQNDLFVAIGNAEIRKGFMKQLSCKKFATLIHPSAVIAKTARIGSGTVVMAGAVINPDVKIGEGCIINTCSSVDHDCILDDYVHVSVGTHLCGTVNVGEKTWIGAGATINNNVNICDNCVIGAGAVVIKDICEQGTYVGVPAKRIRK